MPIDFQKIIFVTTVWPEPRSSAAGVRDLGIIRCLKSQGWRVLVVSPAKKESAWKELSDEGFQTVQCEANDHHFDHIVQEFQPTVTLFDRFVMEEQFSWRVRNTCPECLLVVDSQDLHFLRHARQTFARPGVSFEALMAMNPSISTELIRELSSYHRADLVWTVSESERDRLIQHYDFRADKIRTVSFFYSDLKHRKSFGDRNHFCWIGNFRHPPNRDSFDQLLDLWPSIRSRLPRAELHIYGAYPHADVMSAHDPKIGFNVLGPVDDSIEMLERHRVLLAPLNFGAGIKGKILDAFAAGTPVVTTPVGSEGIASNGTFGGKVCVSESEFIESAVELFNKNQIWNECASRGALNLQQFSREQNEKVLKKSLLDALTDLPAMRSRNLTGAMLWYHKHRSLEFFSRWIELKNERSTAPKVDDHAVSPL